MEKYILEKATKALEEVKKQFDVVGAAIVGSHLHGTATESSDLDIHVVYRPSAYDMLMGVTPFAGRFGASDNDRMVPGQCDIKIIPLNKFLSGLSGGEIGAVELLFAPAMITSDIFEEIKKTSFRAATETLYKNVSSMMKAVIYNLVDKQGYWLPTTTNLLVKCQEGKAKNHIDLAHIHRILHELHSLLALGKIRFGPTYYNPKLYAKVKSGKFSHDDIQLILEEIVEIYKMCMERYASYDISNQFTFSSFLNIIRIAYNIQ